MLLCAIFSATCLAMPLLREALHEVELSSTFRNGLQQLTTPLLSVSPLQQLVSQFYGNFNKGACAHFVFFLPRSIARQVADKIAQCNRALTVLFTSSFYDFYASVLVFSTVLVRQYKFTKTCVCIHIFIYVYTRFRRVCMCVCVCV